MTIIPKFTRLHQLVSMTMMTGIMFTGMRFTLLLDAVHQHAPRLQIGILGALVSLFPMLLSLRVGRRIDLHGPRQPMLVACASLVACGLAGFIDNRMAVLFLLAIFAGIANNAWTIAHQQLVGAFARPGHLAAAYGLSALGYATFQSSRSRKQIPINAHDSANTASGKAMTILKSGDLHRLYDEWKAAQPKE